MKTLSVVGLLPALVLSTLGLCFVSVATAGEDAGVRSAFATGGGDRALALGGAFGGIADDATATIWNPAGLAQLVRNEVQASHATRYGLGFTDQSAFLALPSWRWGVAGLAVRRLGVGGVEYRDEFNVLLDDDLSREEFEVALAYAYGLGDAWSVGAAVKLQRLSFGSYSDEGLGVDVGVLGRPAVALGLDQPWAQRIRLGLALRNLLEPTIRLATESVPDPTGVRLGVSQEIPFAGSRTILWGLDLEKTRDMELRAHAGMEVRLHPLLAVRAGLDNRSWTVGTGFQWQGLAINYTLETNELDSVQRFGLSSRFGSTTHQRRLAAGAAQDRDLQERLAIAFEQRRREQVSALLAEAQVEAEEERIDEALEILETANALDPENQEIVSLMAWYWSDKASRLEKNENFLEAATSYARVLDFAPGDSASSEAVERCRRENERRAARSKELSRRFDESLDAFIQDDLVGARNGFSEVLAADPGDRETSAMLARTEDLISQRVLNLVDRVRGRTGVGEFGQAAALLEEARALGSHRRAVEEAASDLSAAVEASAVEESRRKTAGTHALRTKDQVEDEPPANVGTPGTLTEAKKQELADLYARGGEAIEQGRQTEAIGYWEIVWSIQPEYKQVRDYLKREYIALGMEFFARRDLEQAVGHWQDALRIDPNDPRTIEYLSRARDQMARSRALREGDR